MQIVRLTNSVAAAISNISQVFDPEMGNTPYFGVALLSERPHFYHIPFFDISHMPGRALDALLLAENTFKLSIDEKVVNLYAAALFHSLAGGDALNGFYDAVLKKKRVAFHNLREGLQAINSLVRFRDDQKARQAGDRMVSRILDLVNEDGTWNPQQIAAHEEYLTLGEVVRHDQYFTSTAGRLIGSLVKYHQSAHNDTAIELAIRFCKAVLKNCFDEKGRATDRAGWHVHSITSSISSLAQLADLLDDSALKTDVDRLYRAAFDGRIMTSMGWSKENLENDLDVGEINNTGDMIQTAMFLAKWFSPRYFEDAERMLRSHVIPSQLLETDWILQVKDPRGDFEKDIPRRVHGAFGFPAPYGHQAFDTDFLNFNFDITCGGVQALCEVQKNVVDIGESIRINLLIDFESSQVRISSYFPESASIRIDLLQMMPCEMRLPEWIEVNSIQLLMNHTPVGFEVRDGYLQIGNLPGEYEIKFQVSHEISETWINGKPFRIWWKGNQVISMEPASDFLPFFSNCSAKETVTKGL